jgi:hypothetical protein
MSVVKPRRVVEVGPGNSTANLGFALGRNLHKGRIGTHRVFDPFPVSVASVLGETA